MKYVELIADISSANPQETPVNDSLLVQTGSAVALIMAVTLLLRALAMLVDSCQK